MPRKGIEHAIKLVSLLGDPRCKLVISHDAGDEGYEYQNLLVELAREEGVDLLLIGDRVSEVRQRDRRGRKLYTLWDLYPHADLVTYPSTYGVFDRNVRDSGAILVGLAGLSGLAGALGAEARTPPHDEPMPYYCPRGGTKMNGS